MHEEATPRAPACLVLAFAQVLAACGGDGAGPAPDSTPPPPIAPPPAAPAPAPSPAPAPLLGWQLTTSNIGLAPHGLRCDALPLYTGSAKPAPGTVIRNMRVTVPLDLSSGNILIEKSCIRPNSVGSHHAYLVTTTVCGDDGCQATAAGNVVIRDSEIDASALPVQAIAQSCAPGATRRGTARTTKPPRSATSAMRRAARWSS
ncbi:hypothetical protein ACPOLB_08865 [Rubrivivax sp. RP6-9]|uniref:hypothetical protein n=1 Tax=Rubrivivax sp. RP6-9 TaxID=3415750 RepID=UPI003CC5F520